jgi:hypothetical protein
MQHIPVLRDTMTKLKVMETEVSSVHGAVIGDPVSYTKWLCCPSAYDAGDDTGTA